MNRRTFLSSLGLGAVAAVSPITVEAALAQTCGLIKPVSFTPSDYSTQGVFQLDDINRLFIKWRKANGVTRSSELKPTLFLVGEMEDAHVKAIAFHVSFNHEWLKTATKEDLYRHSSDFFQDEWAAGRLTFFGGIQVRRIRAENHCELI